MANDPRLVVRFYQSSAGKEPVRDWLSDVKQITLEDKKTIGIDIKTVQYGWPMGMPMVRKLESNLWEIRSTIPSGIARVLFTIQGNCIVLLHGFVKKSQKTPLADLDLARNRLKQIRGEK